MPELTGREIEDRNACHDPQEFLNLFGALFTEGTAPDGLRPGRLHGESELMTSAEQWAGIEDVPARTRPERYLAADKPEAVFDSTRTRTLVVERDPSGNVSPDPGDNAILATALAATAERIASVDRNHGSHSEESASPGHPVLPG